MYQVRNFVRWRPDRRRLVSDPRLLHVRVRATGAPRHRHCPQGQIDWLPFFLEVPRSFFMLVHTQWLRTISWYEEVTPPRFSLLNLI